MTVKYEPPTTPARTTRGSPRPIIVNPISEKSPNALKVRMPARKSVISGTEKLAFSAPIPLRALADVDQPVLVAIGQGLEQHAPDHTEDGGVGADAERQRQYDRDGEPFHA